MNMFCSPVTCCRWRWWCCLTSRTESFRCVNARRTKNRRSSRKSRTWRRVCRGVCECRYQVLMQLCKRRQPCINSISNQFRLKLTSRGWLWHGVRVYCRHKTKLAASLARCRVKQSLQSVSCFLSKSVRTKQHRAKSLPVYAWINTLTTRYLLSPFSFSKGGAASCFKSGPEEDFLCLLCCYLNTPVFASLNCIWEHTVKNVILIKLNLSQGELQC